MFERFTDGSRQILGLAQDEARQLDHSFIGTEHLLLGLIRDREGVAGRALASFDIDLTAVREMVKKTIGLAGSLPTGSPPFTPRAKKVLELSLRSALQLGSNEIGTEHLLLGLIREGEGVGAQVLARLGIGLPDLRQRVIAILSETQAGIGDRLTHRPDLPEELRQTMTDPPERVPRLRHQGKLVSCSFCGDAPPESGRMITGNDAFICERCLQRWSEQLAFPSPALHPPHPIVTSDEIMESRRAKHVAVGPPPDDAEAAREAITYAYEHHNELGDDGAGLVNVQGSPDLSDQLRQAATRLPGEPSSAKLVVEDIHFLRPDEAVVWFGVEVNGQRFSMVNGREGRALVEDGRWVVEHATIIDLLQLGGVASPTE